MQCRKNIYQRGPRGGATSSAIKPLMHCAAAPSPTFRIYCSHHNIIKRLEWDYYSGDNYEIINHVLNHTSCGARSKTLPPMVSETVGMVESCAQSTADSPIGLGIRSHSCSKKKATVANKQDQNKNGSTDLLIKNTATESCCCTSLT